MPTEGRFARGFGLGLMTAGIATNATLFYIGVAFALAGIVFGVKHIRTE